MHKFNHDFSCILAIFAVSLFTREWIEILDTATNVNRFTVSLFTREWIEIQFGDDIYASDVVSLFTREWIEILWLIQQIKQSMSLPLYEGVDWNHSLALWCPHVKCLPLYEGVDWNLDANNFCYWSIAVSLFTREWIEMKKLYVWNQSRQGLPLYEGVDWNLIELLFD